MCFNVSMTTTEYASPGAQAHQRGGLLAITRCRSCGAEIVFATSKRTGKRYPVSVSHGYKGQRFYMGHNVHRCSEPQPEVYRPTAAEIRNYCLLELALGLS